MSFLRLVAGILIVAGAFVGLLLLVAQYNGLLEWRQPNYACNGGKRFYQSGRQLGLTAGRIRLYYPLFTWDCPPDHHYDPEKYHPENGRLVPN